MSSSRLSLLCLGLQPQENYSLIVVVCALVLLVVLLFSAMIIESILWGSMFAWSCMRVDFVHNRGCLCVPRFLALVVGGCWGAYYACWRQCRHFFDESGSQAVCVGAVASLAF